MDYPKFLHDEELTMLEKSNDIIYFRYIDKDIFKSVGPLLTDEEKQFLSEGDSHAIVGNALYSKVYSNPKTKILGINSLGLEEENDKQILTINYSYIPKGREYYLVDKNFLR